MDNFATAFDRLLRERGLEQLQVAVEAGISEAAVSNYRRGKVVPAREYIEALARALGISPEYFREYRQAEAEKLIREAMADGRIDLDDIRLILARRDLIEHFRKVSP